LSIATSRSASARTKGRRRSRRRGKPQSRPLGGFNGLLLIAVASAALGLASWWFHARYTLSFQSPVLVSFQLPFVIAERVTSGSAAEAQADQHGHRLSAWQQYACRKFGADCRLALAIQRAENPQGKCEIYHYNSNGTLDWGYFQINTVHLERPGLNLRDLLDCRANIDFAYQLYREKGGFTPWSTYNSGAYRKFMGQ
jgi:hypothetical protein